MSSRRGQQPPAVVTGEEYDIEAVPQPAASRAITTHQLYYVRPSDSKLTPLILQNFQDATSLSPTCHWLRLSAAPLSPVTALAKICYWIATPVLEPGTKNLHLRKAGNAMLRIVVSFPVACLMFYETEIFSYPFQAAVSTWSFRRTLANDGYRPVRHLTQPAPTLVPEHAAVGVGQPAHTNAEATVPASSASEDGDAHTVLFETPDQGTASRPRYLCYIRDPAKNEYETIKVSQFIEKEGDDVDMEYVFVSYTREQFRVATDEEIDNYPDYADDATREANRQLAHKDREILTQWGIDAAKRAGKRAFWVDFECVRDKDGVARSASKSDDVYRICDVVRTAHSMIIAIGPRASDKVEAMLAGRDKTSHASQQATTQWLRHWGSRLWTLPELLLCPNEHRVKLYVLEQSGSDEPVALAKRNFAERAWEDASLVKELVNHYEGSATLSQTQFIQTALECLASRGTHQFSPGDVAYALMGLLPIRQRPAVHPDDTGFQAFARLSLAYDGGDFLSRLIMMLAPEDRGQAWYDNVRDKWGVKIWQMHPSSYVVEMASDSLDTLVMDGAPSASIRWDGFDEKVIMAGEWVKGINLLVYIIWAIVARFLPAFILLALESSLDLRDSYPYYLLTLMETLTFSCWSAFLTPILYIWTQVRLRPRQPPADMVGIEGHVDAATIERHLWGFNHGRLRQDEVCSDYLEDESDAVASEQATTPQTKKSKFTLVDTHSMTVTHILTRKPPVAVFAVGSENGKQRAVLCSYSWRDNTFERETVLRIGNRMLAQMRRIGEFRLRLQPMSDNHARTAIMPKLAKEMRTSDPVPAWKLELLFVIITLLGIHTLQPLESYRHSVYQAVGFALVQIPAFFFLGRFSLAKILPQLLLLRGIVHIIELPSRWPCKNKTLTPKFSSASTAGWLAVFVPTIETRNSLGVAIFAIYNIAEGASRGLIFAVLLVCIWSWWRLSPAQLTARMLLFALCTGLLPTHVLRSDPALTASLFALAVILSWNRLGRPDEIRWLPASAKRRLGQSLTSAVSALPRHRLAAFVFFTVAALERIPPGFSLYLEEFDEVANNIWFIFGLMLFTVASTVVVRACEKGVILLAVVVIFLSSMSIEVVEQTDQYIIPLLIIANLRFASLPLLLILANSRSEPPWLQLQTIVLLVAGTAVGNLLRAAINIGSLKAQLPASIISIILLATLYAFERRVQHHGPIALL